MSSPARPFTAHAFNQYLAEHKLMASRCTACGVRQLPPRALCPGCHSDAQEWIEIAGHGRLAAYTVIAVPPPALAAEGYSRDNPYCAAIVELEHGLKISARLLDVDVRHPATIEIGRPVTVAFMDRGEGDQRTTTLAFRV